MDNVYNIYPVLSGLKVHIIRIKSILSYFFLSCKRYSTVMELCIDNDFAAVMLTKLNVKVVAHESF